LTELLGIDRSSVFRLATTLKRRGFLANPNSRKDYILGPSIWRLSRKYDWSNVLITFSHERLKALADKTGETAHLAVREGRSALFIDHYSPSNHSIVVSGRTGELIPLHCTAHGKAVLADCGLAELKAVFGSSTLQARTSRTIVSLPQLAKACATVKADGYAIDNAEFEEEIRCLASPIRDKDGAIVASIGISAPASRLPQERVPAVGRQVSAAAKEISSILNAEAEKARA
jgi:IclR family acetate operon transcriptional repressor